jgi:hypothetical protein
VRLLPRVPPHVHDEHVLRLERLLLPRAPDPRAYERLLVGPDVVGVQVLDQLILGAHLPVAANPVAVRFLKVGFFLDGAGIVAVKAGRAAACKGSDRLTLRSLLCTLRTDINRGGVFVLNRARDHVRRGLLLRRGPTVLLGRLGGPR